MIAWHLLCADQLGLTLLGALPQRPLPTSLSQPAVPSFLKGCLAEQLLFTGPLPSQVRGDLPEPSHLSLFVAEELLLQHFSHLLLFL